MVLYVMAAQVDRQSTLLRRGKGLEWLTLAWNVIGVAVLTVTAWRARSPALAGFGLDSLIEILASAIVLWQLAGTGSGRERAALRVISVSFALLGGYVVGQTGFLLIGGGRPAPSLVGSIWLAMTVVVMLALASGKRRVGRELGNQVLVSEAGVTMVDAFLAFAVLVGVVLNALLGWWWADPISSLAIVAYALRESRAAWAHADVAAYEQSG